MIDGPVLVQEALASGIDVWEVLVEPGEAPEVVQAAGERGVTVLTVAPGVLARAVDITTPQGIVAVAARPEVDREVALAAAAEGPLTLVLVDVADPGNAGTLLRAAEASGAAAVLFCGTSVDPCNPKCVRASAGALFHLPVAGGGDAVSLLEGLGRHGVRRVGTIVRDGAPYHQVDLSGPVALVLGSEAHGLPGDLGELLDVACTIPMAGRSESLNVAMAGSILCFESLRQRGAT